LHSAHISPYGERAADTFYLTGGDNRKLTSAVASKLRLALKGAADG